ncbi:MAG: ChaN family lipoprotein [Alphaproteobacteria bacterium]|nr:ChaN family lipoprotein [Alphaproteobacteria bacterium]
MLLLSLGSCTWLEENVPLPSVEKLVALTERDATWQSSLSQHHHLVGRIWRPGDGSFVDQKTLAADLARSAYILLGEKHDNPDHHLLQARLIRSLTALGRRPAVVWEMIPEFRQQILNSYWAKYSRDAAALGGTLGWDVSGWPAWSMYQPIAKAAMAAHLPMYAAGLSKASVRTLARGKPSFAFAKRQRSLGLDRPLPKVLRLRSLEQLYQAHCGLMPRDALGPLLNVQRARDAVMAEHMLASSLDDGALLIAGTGHVRKDLGVPIFLARHQPNVRITTVAFMEVQEGVLDPSEYAESFSASAVPFDYVWFTPRADDEDHCAKLRKNWQKPEAMNTDATADPSTKPSGAPGETPAETPAIAPTVAPAEAPEAPEAAKTTETPEAPVKDLPVPKSSAPPPAKP